MPRKRRSEEAIYGTDNIMSDGMNPPITADELINTKIKAKALAGQRRAAAKERGGK